jgi:hypothetical protein
MKTNKKTCTYFHLHGKGGSRGLPIPCLGFGLSARGFWKGKVIGNSITSYLTPKCPSEASSLRSKKKRPCQMSARLNFSYQTVTNRYIVQNKVHSTPMTSKRDKKKNAVEHL